METVADLGRVRAAINEAALDGSRWREALECVAAAAGSDGAALFTVDPASEPFAAGCGTATDAIHEYMQRWSAADPWFNIVAAREVWWEPGHVEFGPAMVPVDQLHRTAFHCDFLRSYAIEHLISLKVASSRSVGSHGTHLSLYRPASRSDFGTAERAVLRALWPTVRRAVAAHAVLGGALKPAGGAEASLEALALPAWVVGAGAFIQFQNQAAARWLAAAHGPAALRQGSLREIGTLDDATLAQALAAAAAGAPSALVAAMPGELHARRALLHVTPLPPALRTVWPRGVALLVLRLPAEPDEKHQWLRHLSAAHGLTAAEAAVLRHVADGLSPREVADRLHISYATVRTHLLMLYQKTGCRRQAELVRLAV